MRLNPKLVLMFVLVLLLSFPLYACSSPPEAKMAVSSNSGQAPFSVIFTNESVNADRFEWDFGDGASLNAADVKESVTHEYRKAGTYTVKLTAIKGDGAGEKSTVSQTITVNAGAPYEVKISPGEAKTLPRQQMQFSASVVDAFGNDIPGLPLSWKTGKAGLIDASGLFTPGLVPGRYLKEIQATVTANGKEITGTASVDISFSSSGTPAIDGAISLEEWGNSSHADFTVNVPGGGTAPAALFVMNDKTNLYLAVRVAVNQLYGTSLAFEFDRDRNGERDAGIMLNDPNTFIDHMNGLLDVDQGGTSDGAGRVANNGAFTMYELMCPLDSADDRNDFSLAPGDSIRFRVSLRMVRVPSEWPRDFGDTDYPPGSWLEIVIAK